MQNFCFRLVIFFDLRKVGFRLVQAYDFPIVWKILILLAFWCRIPNYFLVDFALLSFEKSLTCVWFHRFRSLFRLFFQISLYGQQPRNFSLLLLESFKTFVGVFLTKFIKISYLTNSTVLICPLFILEN